MKIESLSLKDFSGGLNDHDPASGLAQNECARLENYFTDNQALLTKRAGKEIAQDLPINPVTYTTDANTLGLWHMDEAGGGPCLDSSGNGRDLALTVATQVPGVFSYAQKMRPITASGQFASAFLLASPGIDNQPALTIDAWIKIDLSFSGRPVYVDGVEVGNNNSGIFTTVGAGGTERKVELVVRRDWDSTNQAEASEPYIVFSIAVYGAVGLQALVRSPGLPMGSWINVRATYSSATGYSELYINGHLVDRAAPVGGGNVDASGISASYVGARTNDAFDGSNTFNGTIDELRISNVDRGGTDFPFDSPRGMGFEFSKSDGTRQAVVSATDKLWYTLGDGTYTQMKFFDGLVPAFSTVAYWDAIFRDDILYLANGVDPTLAWDGATLCAWMNPTVAPTLSLAASSGTITAGTRQVAYSYVYGDYETGLSPAVEIENAGGFHINVADIPPRHINVTAVRIYEDKAGTPGTWYLVRQIAHTPGVPMGISGAYTPGSSPSYTSDAGGLGPADASLGSAGFPLVAASVATNASPNPKYLLAEHDRAFVCGMEDERYTLRFSQLGAFDVFGVFSYANATSNQGNLIGLASYYGEVHCSKDGRATLILRGSNPQNWRVLETLHPNVGAIDHWSYVHRYPVDSDQYVLCFKGREGFYAYAGQQIQCISEKIKGSVDRLASNNATRNEWAVTTTAQFQAQSAQGGASTANVQASRYETDGLRQEGGRAKIVDQLDYLGLWSYAAQLVAGNVIAVCKGQNPEEFYFSTDAATTLYWTGDNFQTVLAIATPLATAERIIEIVKQGAANTYFLITDSAGSGNSSGGGMVYSVADPTGSDGIGPAYATLTTTLYYDLDVPIRLDSPSANAASGRTIGHGVYNLATSPNNIFINHAQTASFLALVNTFGGSGVPRMTIYNNPSVSGNYSSALIGYDMGAGSNSIPQALSAGFFAVEVVKAPLGTLDLASLVVLYTRREFPRWRGGTFGPQCYWDATNSRLVFLASTAEDANGNRSTYLRTLTAAGVLTNQYTAKNVSAFAADGTSVYFWTVEDPGGGGEGFYGYPRKSTLAAPGTVTLTGAVLRNYSALRLSYNSQVATTLLAAFKTFNTGTQELWTYVARMASVLVSTLAPTTLVDLTANGDSGTTFSEIAVQTTTPYRWYVATSRISTADSAALYVVTTALAASVFKGSAYESPSADAAVNGIISNLLFMPSQDAGLPVSPMWADRLYWFASAAAASNARMVQLGVPGTWTVTGALSSELHNLGVFSAFDNLESGFTQGGNSNGLLFEVRNAADAAALVAATYQQQVANQKILGFSPVQPYFQWRITFTWSYSVANPTTSPTVDFVNVGFFLGQANLPRTIGFQWEGRTFWACAEDGAEENNTVLVYQKNGSWTKIYGWRPKSMFRFRNQFVALEDYQLVRLLSGTTDAGALIVGKARTGAIMGFLDKLLSRVQANVLAFANSLFSSRDGYVKITPYQNSTAIDDGAWVIPIPNATDKEPVRVLGEPDDEFTYNWIRALSLEIGTSEDTEGDWVPQLGQAEEIQQIDLELELTGDSYDIVVQ